MLTNEQRRALVEALDNGGTFPSIGLHAGLRLINAGLAVEVQHTRDDGEPFEGWHARLDLTEYGRLLAAEIKAHEETRDRLQRKSEALADDLEFTIRAHNELDESNRALALERDTLRAKLDECREALREVHMHYLGITAEDVAETKPDLHSEGSSLAALLDTPGGSRC